MLLNTVLLVNPVFSCKSVTLAYMPKVMFFLENSNLLSSAASNNEAGANHTVCSGYKENI